MATRRLVGKLGAFAWTPTASGPVTIKSRAVDDSGNLETPAAGVSVTVAGSQTTIWSSQRGAGIVDAGPGQPRGIGREVLFGSGRNGQGNSILQVHATTRALMLEVCGRARARCWRRHRLRTRRRQVGNRRTLRRRCRSIRLRFMWPLTTPTQGITAPISTTSRPSVRTIRRCTPPPTGGSWGPNGVYAYGTNSTFPNQTWNATNYWVDVVLQPGPPPTLTSIAVTPASPTVADRSHTAVHGNGNVLRWKHAEHHEPGDRGRHRALAVATINASGLASGVSAGSDDDLGDPVRCDGSSRRSRCRPRRWRSRRHPLPNGTVNAAYSATLAANGGTPPYTWSIVSGSLPSGLTLNPSTGAITGTPTASGKLQLHRQVTDSGNPAQSATKALNMTIASATTTIWPSTAVPGIVDGGPDSPVELGVKFRSDVSGTIRGIRFYKAATNTGTHVGNLWSSTGSLLATGTFSGETASGWQQLNFTTPVNITANTVYVASYHTNTGHYSINTNYFTSSRGGQCAAACAGQRRERGQRRVSIWREQRLPQPELEFLQLLGGCGVRGRASSDA